MRNVSIPTRISNSASNGTARYVAGISKVGALKRTTEVVKHREGGDPSTSRKSPGRTKYEAITLERGVTHDTEFDRWANKVWNFGSGLGAEVSLKDFRKDIIIDVLQRGGPAGDLATRSTAAGCRNFRRCPTSMPMPTPSRSSTSSSKTKAGNEITRCPSPVSRALPNRKISFKACPELVEWVRRFNRSTSDRRDRSRPVPTYDQFHARVVSQ